MTNKIKLTQKKELIKKKPKKTIKGDDIMKINLDTAKRRVQKDTTHYIMGVKFVTTETPETVLQTIKKDFMIYPNIIRIVVQKNMIRLMLDNNATLYTFYFLKKEVFDEVVPKLKDFNVEVIKL